MCFVFTSLFIDNGLRITYTAKYGTIDAQTEDLKTEAGLFHLPLTRFRLSFLI